MSTDRLTPERADALLTELARASAERNRNAEHAEKLTRQLRTVKTDQRTAEDEIGRLRRQVAELIAERNAAGKAVRAAICADIDAAIARSKTEDPTEIGAELRRWGMQDARAIAAGQEAQQ